ncbi:MAG: ATP-binding cassette domain-containing protein [Anaerolineae bacterium]
MIVADKLGKQFEAFTAVHNLSLHIHAGELLALLGPNGAGKTTTVRMLGGILKPSRGRALINGLDVTRYPHDVRRQTGMLTEQPGLYLRMSGMEYLVFYGRLYRMPDSDTEKRGQYLFQQFGMAGAAHRRLGENSKGMRQKVGLMRAMLHDPAVLLLDEPTSAMDPHSAKLVRDAISNLRDDKRAIILCTHNLAEAESLADRIAIIKQGAIVAQGTPSQLKQQLLGHPQIEVRVNQHLNGQVREIEDLVAVEYTHADTIRFRTENPDETNPQMVACLHGLGLGVISIHEVSQSLEDVYLRVVEEK